MILNLFYPEIFLSFSILFQLILNAQIVNNISYNFPILNKELFSQTIFILFCLLILFINLKVENIFYNFMFVIDKSSRLIKIIFIFVCIFSLIFIYKAFCLQRLNFFEFYVILLITILSSLLLVTSYDLLTIYLLLEMQALCFYVLASFKRTSSFSTESGLKYFILGSIISCFFLLGLSILYGALGTLNLHYLSLLTSFSFSEYIINFLLVGIFFITITFLFKLAVVPFHFWIPDIYEGAPLCSTITFSILAKPILLNLFIKWIFILNTFFNKVEFLLLITGLLSIFVGTFLSLKQKRIKRLIIYSSIGQMGFFILSLSLNSYESIVYTYFYLFVYIITSILIWGHLVCLYIFKNKINIFFNRSKSSIFISDLGNYFKINPLWSFSFLIIFFSISGIPLFSGFIAKVLILLELIYQDYLITAITLLTVSSVSIFYYMRIIKIIFFEPNFRSISIPQVQISFEEKNLDFICYIFVLFLFSLIFIFFFPNPFLLFCHYITITTYAF